MRCGDQGSSSPAQHVRSYRTHPPGVCRHYRKDLSNCAVITGQTFQTVRSFRHGPSKVCGHFLAVPPLLGVESPHVHPHCPFVCLSVCLSVTVALAGVNPDLITSLRQVNLLRQSFKPQQLAYYQFKSIVGARLIGFICYASQANDRTGGLSSGANNHAAHSPLVTSGVCGSYRTAPLECAAITALSPLECGIGGKYRNGRPV